MIIYALKLDLRAAWTANTKLLDVLSADEQNRFNRLQNQLAARQFFAGRVLLRYMLCKHYNFSNDAIKIAYNRYGKPLLNDNSLQFSIAHSKAWLVCAVAADAIGIDVEKIAAWRERVAKRFLSKSEYSALTELSTTEKTEQFYSIWTLKESYSKAIGRGLTVPFNSFSIKKSQLNGLFITDDHYWLKQYDIDQSYKLSVCCAEQVFAKDISVITEQLADRPTLTDMADFINRVSS